VITEAKYTKSWLIDAVIDDVQYYGISDDVDNRHRRMLSEWEAEGNVIEPYVAPTTAPSASISRRQFYQAASVMGEITKEEALAALDGVIPQVLNAIIEDLPGEDLRFAARMHLKGSTEFLRQHPVTEAVAAGLDWSSEEVDQFFVLAATL
jgi:hypothetical protein